MEDDAQGAREKGTRVRPDRPPLCLLYADDVLAAVNKPSGLIVHRGLGTDKVVVMTLLRDQLGGRHVYPVHRLDRGTSGALLFALSPETARMLQSSFESGEVNKRYLALVRGICPEKAHIDHPVPRCEDGERVDAVTDVRRLGVVHLEIGSFSLVEATPFTGRYHQIRRHLKHLNHPLVGDVRYGKGEINRFFRERFGLHRLALHAASIRFPHPASGRMLSVEAPIPDDLAAVFGLFGSSK